jgi:hypothetical protein
VNRQLSAVDIDGAVNPNDHLCAVTEFVNRALDAYRKGRAAS